MILEEKEENISTKEYSKGVSGIIERFCEIIIILILFFSIIIVSLSFYWLAHWVLFGRNVYLDIFNLSDMYSSD